MQVKTDLRFRPVAAARDVSFEPQATISATNVQDAIEQTAAASGRGTTETAVTLAMSPYTVLPADDILLVDTSAGAVTIVAPLSSTRLLNGRYVPFTVKDATGNSAANPISVVRTAPDTLDGLNNYQIDSAFTAVTFQPKAASYAVI